MKKLHIGSGRVYLPGWTNVDLFSSAKADLFCDMMRLPFDRGSFDLIYCCHCLEHAHRNSVLAILHHWRDLLRIGGILRLSVPDFSSIANRYIKTGNLPELIGLLYGGQTHPLNVHTTTFDKATLSGALSVVGFSEIREWDWKNTEHSQYDDYSREFLPHLDFEAGTLMSLNIEAVA
jgi:predicted SAM-dependent methyltransferase